MNWFIGLLAGYGWMHHTTRRRYGSKTPEEILKAREEEGAVLHERRSLEERAKTDKTEK